MRAPFAPFFSAGTTGDGGLRLGAGEAPASMAPRGVEASAPSLWYRSPFRMFQTNLLDVDADMDVEKVLDFIQGFGCDTWLVNGGGILSFYPTRLEHQTRNPYLARPVLTGAQAGEIQGLNGTERVRWAESRVADGIAGVEAAQKAYDDAKANPPN